MKHEQQQKLEAAGWQVGSVKEFLGLTQAESQFVEMRLALSQALQTQRQKIKLTQTALAKRLGSSQSRVARIEAADASVSLDLMIRALLAAGASNKDIAQAIEKF
jgi:ribosome-binding protein aMBF1 (putative translation factor)